MTQNKVALQFSRNKGNCLSSTSNSFLVVVVRNHLEKWDASFQVWWTGTAPSQEEESVVHEGSLLYDSTEVSEYRPGPLCFFSCFLLRRPQRPAKKVCKVLTLSIAGKPRFDRKPFLSSFKIKTETGREEADWGKDILIDYSSTH